MHCVRSSSRFSSVDCSRAIITTLKRILQLMLIRNCLHVITKRLNSSLIIPKFAKKTRLWLKCRKLNSVFTRIDCAYIIFQYQILKLSTQYCVIQLRNFSHLKRKLFIHCHPFVRFKIEEKMAGFISFEESWLAALHRYEDRCSVDEDKRIKKKKQYLLGTSSDGLTKSINGAAYCRVSPSLREHDL